MAEMEMYLGIVTALLNKYADPFLKGVAGLAKDGWEKFANVNSKCEKNIKKYNQASRANSSRHSANTISEVFQPNISRG